MMPEAPCLRQGPDRPLSASDLRLCTDVRVAERFADGAEYGRYTLDVLTGIRALHGLVNDEAAVIRAASAGRRILLDGARLVCSCEPCQADARISADAAWWLWLVVEGVVR